MDTRKRKREDEGKGRSKKEREKVRKEGRWREKIVERQPPLVE